ncbi:hypothetical protein BGE01nite_25030 [Brevifollis gellanilyticus]|uniref:Uncharacterized protein n=2 Tax=Brevifollis gellanilyticus TaxID=748831 RepID=A0A512M913_9BACT|nr:hypothetical protein BGE01nite_25030 [Brevifollis gellanilyticus]
MVEDFDSAPTGTFQKGFLDIHRWTEEFRQRARAWSSIEVTPEGSGKALRVCVSDPQAFTAGAGSFLRLAPYYPPETDALRLRVKVLTGQVSIYVGGPTAYYGNSDVYSEPQTIHASAKLEWVEIICHLNHPTWRNYRRSGFSTEAPRNYYNRWAQEDVGVFLAPDSLGECLIDDIEILALGEGKPFASFAPEQVQEVKQIVTFEDGKLDHVFNLYMAAAEAEWFDESWIRSRHLRFKPMQLEVNDSGLKGLNVLECKGATAEEVQCTGVRTSGADANGIRLTINVHAPGQSNSLVGAGAIVPMDFLVFVAADGQAFPWESLEPSAELRAKGGPGFDYNLTHRVIAARKDLNFAIYQTRRYLKPDEWTHLVLPTADFTCIYGQGSMRDRFLNHDDLRSEEVIAFAWLNPWCRQGRRDEPVTTSVEKLSFVKVPGTAAEHRSFWQVPDVKQLQHRDEESPGLRKLHIWLPGDPEPPSLLR